MGGMERDNNDNDTFNDVLLIIHLKREYILGASPIFHSSKQL